MYFNTCIRDINGLSTTITILEYSEFDYIFSTRIYYLWGKIVDLCKDPCNTSQTSFQLFLKVSITSMCYRENKSFRKNKPFAHDYIVRNSWTIIRSLEKTMAPHSNTLAWKISWTEEPGRLQSMGSLRVRHDWGTSLSFFTFIHWRMKWQPTPTFLPGESQGRWSLVGCRLWSCTESDTTEAT